MPKIITDQIKDYVLEHYNYSNEELEVMTLGRQLYLVSLHNMDQWEIFKLGLRKVGFII